MPIDTQATDSIIKAFMAGRELARQKTENTQKQEKEAQDRADRLAAQEEAKKQFEAELKQKNDQFTIAHKAAAIANEIVQAQAKSQFTQTLQEGGNLPDYTKTTTTPRTYNGMVSTGYESSYTPTDPNSNLPKLNNVLDPESYAKIQAHLEDIKTAPKTNAAIQIKEAESAIKAKEELAKQTFEAGENQKKLNNAIQVAHIRARAASNPLDKLLIHDMTPLSTSDLEKYHVPAGTTYAQIKGQTPGLKLTPAQQNKIDYLKDMLSDAIDAEALLNPLKSGIGYENYFYGKPGILSAGSGIVSEALAGLKGEGDETKSLIRNKLGSVFDKRKVESAGKVLSAAEFKLLRNYVPPYEHTALPAQAKTNLEEFIKGINELIQKLESEYSGGKKRLSLEEILK